LHTCRVSRKTPILKKAIRRGTANVTSELAVVSVSVLLNDRMAITYCLSRQLRGKSASFRRGHCHPNGRYRPRQARFLASTNQFSNPMRYAPRPSWVVVRSRSLPSLSCSVAEPEVQLRRDQKRLGNSRISFLIIIDATNHSFGLIAK